jgi:hypothetical protein
VDEDQPETQPPGFLGVCGEREWGLVYTTCHVTDCIGYGVPLEPRVSFTSI